MSGKAWTLAAGTAVAVLVAAGVAFGPAIFGDEPAVERTVAEVDDMALASAPKVTVYKSPTCGCCTLWVEHMRNAGFDVEPVDVETGELMAVKGEHGVDGELSSCHTALIGDYVIEGHVPAGDIVRLLQERPDIRGLAVPGMPIGTPGMEMPGAEKEAYEVVAFDAEGGTEVFARH